MLFNSLPFWVFFAIVLLLVYGAPARFSKPILVIASFAFYGLWNPWLMLLLAGCVLFNYATGLLIGRAMERGALRTAKAWLALAVIGDVGLLGFFKYTGLLVATVTNLLHLPPSGLAASILLPVAISFYTFEAISYNVDVYRHALHARRSLVDFALFISFFPHLVAGPIIRPAHFFPQLDTRPIPSGDAVAWGVVQIVKGLIKKTVFADNFAIIANAYFDTQAGHGGAVAAWVGVLAFSMQIYFDFSGYTDIARGCARLLGYDFPPNFERPYLAADITAFWRRWHISLSTWLRDYLYIPLGGNRRGTARTYINLLITMGLGGLWHGASWNFVLWGLYHGVLLALHRIWRSLRGERPAIPSRLGRAASVALTFLLVTLGWVTFRVADFGTTLRVFADLVTPPATTAIPREMTVLLAIITLWLLIDRNRRAQRWLSEGTSLAATIKVSTALAVSLLALELFSRTDIAVPFIYFQF